MAKRPKLVRTNKWPFVRRMNEQDQRELDTILAALRYWQQNVLDRKLDPAQVSPMHFEYRDWPPLDADEVNDLCEKLNFGG